MRSILVTGGAGFIGSHVIERLLAQGDQVCVVDDFSSGKPEHLPQDDRLQLIQTDAGNLSPSDLPRNAFFGLIHLAALPSVAKSWESPLEAHHRTLTTTLHLLHLAATRPIQRFVIASSAAVYGQPTCLPIPETAHLQPLSPYGLQKKMSEDYADLWGRARRLSCTALRLFNVYGPRQDPSSPYSGVISIFRTALESGQDIHLHGGGTQTRDFIYVKDVAEAFVRALQLPLSPGCTPINICTGRSTSITQLFTLMRKLRPSWNGQTLHTPSREGDICHSVGDPTRMAQALGLTQPISLETGLSDWIGKTPAPG